MQFTAAAGTTYHIAVDGFNGASSRVNLGLNFGSGGLRAQLLSPIHFTDGRAEFVIRGDANRAYTIKASADLITWTAIGSVTTSVGSATFTDFGAPGFAHRFYRTRD